MFVFVKVIGGNYMVFGLLDFCFNFIVFLYEFGMGWFEVWIDSICEVVGELFIIDGVLELGDVL